MQKPYFSPRLPFLSFCQNNLMKIKRNLFARGDEASGQPVILAVRCNMVSPCSCQMGLKTSCDDRYLVSAKLCLFMSSLLLIRRLCTSANYVVLEHRPCFICPFMNQLPNQTTNSSCFLSWPYSVTSWFTILGPTHPYRSIPYIRLSPPAAHNVLVT